MEDLLPICGDLCELMSCIYLAETVFALRRCIRRGLALLADAGLDDDTSARVMALVAPAVSSASSEWPKLPKDLGQHPMLRLLWRHFERAHDRVARLQQGKARQDQWARLTPRERQVLHHVSLGQTDGLIAKALGIAPRTVSKHVENILEKLDVETRTAAAGVVFHGASGAGRRMTKSAM